MADLLSRLKAALADRYDVKRELGAGRMATVYLAEDLKHKCKVAVKVLQWKGAGSTTATVEGNAFTIFVLALLVAVVPAYSAAYVHE